MEEAAARRAAAAAGGRSEVNLKGHTASPQMFLVGAIKVKLPMNQPLRTSPDYANTCRPTLILLPRLQHQHLYPL